MDIRVPSELWFDTFRHLPRDSLISIHSVSRTFYRISQPLLVRTFVFHPYMALSPYKKEGFQYRLPGEDIVKRTYRRLRFWGSDAVAPFVHECVITPWHPLERNYNDYVYCDHGDIILSSFFEILPRFTSIKTILFSCVDLPPWHKIQPTFRTCRPSPSPSCLGKRYATSPVNSPLSERYIYSRSELQSCCLPVVRRRSNFFLCLSRIDDRAKFVTTLEVHFADLGTNPSAFWTLLGKFGILVRFQMNIRSVGGSDCDEKTLYGALAASSPFAVGITEVEINWPYGSDVAEAEIGSAAQSAKTMLVSAHPGLERIHFSSPRQAYSWIRQEDAD